jgi:two-component system, cell cycle response regulator DivK
MQLCSRADFPGDRESMHDPGCVPSRLKPGRQETDVGLYHHQVVRPNTSPLAVFERMKRPHILLVEDDVAARRILPVMARRFADFSVAEDAARALDLITEQNFDLILMDIQLGPGMNGTELLADIRKRELVAPEIPIIACTAYAYPGDRDHFLNIGFHDYLPKPIMAEDLKATVERWVGLSDGQD